MKTATRDLRRLSAHTGDNRGTLRRPVKLKARVRDRRTSRFDVNVVDLSLTGFRGDTVFLLTPGARIWIMLPGLASLEAEIAWCRNNQFGARFRQPLYPAVFEHIAELAGR
jgi:hypothetical protein